MAEALTMFDLPLAARHDRRAFFRGLALLAGAAASPASAFESSAKAPRFSVDPYSLGIASGDASSDGVVLWTLLAPDPVNGGGMPSGAIPVQWELAADEGMKQVLRRGTAVARPEWAHSVHVEVEGLPPDRWYWYRFRAGDAESPIGRTRTMPDVGSSPERLRFAFASCQHYESGLFTAYEHMAKDDLDLVVHLGDYIYEAAAGQSQIRRHLGPKCTKLEHYRTRYGQYKSDPHLRAMHAQVPWIVTPDDHEFANNCASLISELKADDPAEYRARRAYAYQAYWEHMPLRRRSLPQGPDMRLYRRPSFGDLARFHVLDTRQYRTDQPCGDGNKPPCPEALSEFATLMGKRQREWLFRGLHESEAQWNILAQQVMMGRVDRVPGDVQSFSMDQWPGYEFERRRVLRHFKEGRVSNPIVLTGDIHTHWCNQLLAEPEGTPVGAEFVGSSISSGGDGTATPGLVNRLYAENPFVKYYAAQRGYVRCEVTRATWRTDYRVLDFVTRPGSPARNGASFMLETGRPGLIRI